MVLLMLLLLLLLLVYIHTYIGAISAQVCSIHSCIYFLQLPNSLALLFIVAELDEHADWHYLPVFLSLNIVLSLPHCVNQLIGTPEVKSYRFKGRICIL